MIASTMSQTTGVMATPGTTIRVEPDTSIAQVGESFTVNITIREVHNLYGVEVLLRWNASILQILTADVRFGVESFSDGILHEPVFTARNEAKQDEGEYFLVGTSTVPAGSFNGSGNIVIVTFKIINIGSCGLNLETALRGKPPPGGVAPEIYHTTFHGFFGHQIGLSALPMQITLGEEVNISGFIVPSQTDIEVTILYRSRGEEHWGTLATLRTDEQGEYEYRWRAQEDDGYEIRATAVIDGQDKRSSSIFVTVKTPEQSILVYVAIVVFAIILLGVLAIATYRRMRGRTSTNRF